MPLLERYRNLIFLVIALAIFGGVGALLTYRPPATVITIIPPLPTPTPLPSATPGPMRVYVTGAVVNPGNLFTLPPGSRVDDAVKAAGGLIDDADVARVNLAALLRDGDQVNVPIIGMNRSASLSDAMPTASGPVHINTATIDDLQRLPGCGPSLAQQILNYRQKNGAFKSFADLDRVSGVGKAKIDAWQNLIVFD